MAILQINRKYLTCKMAKKAKKASPSLPKKLNLPNDEPVKLNMSFEDAIKKALNTPTKKSKVNKK